MEVAIKVLDGMLRHVSPSRIIELIQRPQRLFDGKHQKILLERYCSSSLPDYSLNEQEVILRQICLNANREAGESNSSLPEVFLPQVAVYTTLLLAKSILVSNDSTACCRIEQTLTWREASLLLGQDLFVCAFLAWKDLQRRQERTDFSWPAVIRTDHTGLNSMIRRGLAENHQHLYGSSQTFALNWCSLMNDPGTHPTAGKIFQELFSAFPLVDSEDKILSAQESAQYACLCRMYLFQWEKTRTGKEEDELAASFVQQLWHCPAKFFIVQELPVLRGMYGALVPQLSGRSECLDYALEHSVFWACPDGSYRALAGERNLLYRCFRRMFQERMRPKVQMIFYLYLVLKSMFRGEMIQINRKVGFQNFANYQDRKDALCQRPCYKAELIRMAINAPLAHGHVTSLETRFSPQDTTVSDYLAADSVDRLYDFACRPCTGLPGPSNGRQPEERPYFFVFHFIKKPDKDLEVSMPQCRHAQLRKVVRKKAVALAKALSRSDKLCRRVRGIDAASNEVTCPPEVFSMAFRFLRGFRPADFVGSSVLHPPTAPRLSATYHVGEDFMDIASALRAIDEAILFLGLHRGDRLGHALGLGVAPELHYRRKGRKIFQPKQERLDDLIWLSYRARELGAHIDAHLYGELKKEAEMLFLQIYGPELPETVGIPLSEYYYSTQIRGDNPTLYVSERYRPTTGLIHPYDEFGVIDRSDLESYREHTLTAKLYYLYHFSQMVKRSGAEPVVVSVQDSYIRLMRDMQDAMQENIRNIGLAIECNPSSNVLIGTFRSYGDHPIFRFNNAALEQQNAEKRRRCKQLQVCVNTDDLGVFDTSQEFEYALLFETLSELREEDGSRTYHETDVISYLDSLREKGLEVAFPSV